MASKKLKKNDLIRYIDQEISNSSTYNTKISRDRATAIKYYNGEPFGNERKGRSTYVSSDVMEVISWCMPQVMKIFASEDVVQFDPNAPGSEQAAHLATEYCKWVLHKKNDGFMILHNGFHDALLQKNGTVKIYFDNTPEYIREDYKGLSDLELAQLLQDPTVEPIAHETIDGQIDLMTGQPTRLHDISLKRKKGQNGCVRIENVPPEEIIVSKKARSLNLNDSPFVAHRVKRTISWLRQQGYKVADDINDGTETTTEYSDERLARELADGTYYATDYDDPPVDPSMREVWVVEAYLKVDFNNDGIAECRKVTKVGDTILDNEEVDSQPFVTTTPFPQPHKWNGKSLADIVKDLQLLKSMLMRVTLDSFAFNINPSKAVDITKVIDLNDLLDTNPGNYIRMRGDINNAVYAFPSSGVGQEAFTLLEYVDNITESRSGVSRMTQGIDANVFNKTATGVQTIMTASQEKIALIVRIFAETFVGEMYKKIVQLASNFVKSPELIQVNQQFIEVDPRAWSNLNTITVVVGTGGLDKQLEAQNAQQIIQLQQTLASSGMPEAIAMVSPDRVYNSISRLVKAMGYKNPTEFFQLPGSDQYMQMLEMAQQRMQPPPDPNMELAKAETMKAQNAAVKVQQDAYLDQNKIELDRVVSQEQMRMKELELQLKYELEIAKLDLESRDQLLKEMKTEADAIAAHQMAKLDNLTGQLEILQKMQEISATAEQANAEVRSKDKQSELLGQMLQHITDMKAEANKPRNSKKTATKTTDGSWVISETAG